MFKINKYPLNCDRECTWSTLFRSKDLRSSPLPDDRPSIELPTSYINFRGFRRVSFEVSIVRRIEEGVVDRRDYRASGNWIQLRRN